MWNDVSRFRSDQPVGIDKTSSDIKKYGLRILFENGRSHQTGAEILCPTTHFHSAY
jgi:hypothetical protein